MEKSEVDNSRGKIVNKIFAINMSTLATASSLELELLSQKMYLIMWYRFTPQEIAALKSIAWWDWSDDKIRECYDDFYMDICVLLLLNIYNH